MHAEQAATPRQGQLGVCLCRLFEAFHEPFRKSLNASEALPEAAPDAQGQMDARAADTITGLNPDLVVLDSDEELDEPDLA